MKSVRPWTLAYLGYVALNLAGPLLDLGGVWVPAVLLCSVVAGAAVLLRHRLPWLFPAVALLGVPLVGPSLTYAGVASVSVRRRDRLAVGYALAAVAAGLVPSLWNGGGVQITRSADGAVVPILHDWVEVAVHAVVVLVAYLIGAVVGTRRDLLVSYRDRAERAESERAARAREAVLLERARIAREMHDILGHKLSLVTMQAGALEVNAGAGADAVEQQAARIRVTAREALEDLRAVVGALEESEASLRPAPGLCDAVALVGANRQAGAVVDLEDTVTQRPEATDLDATAGRAVYRVLTEALTNAHRHAPGSPVRVRLTGTPGERLEIVVDNPIPAGPTGAGDGTGLPGLAERVRLAGGTFAAGPRGDAWVVRATFPWNRSRTPAAASTGPSGESTS